MSAVFNVTLCVPTHVLRWSLGAVVYECVSGVPPGVSESAFLDRDKERLTKEIIRFKKAKDIEGVVSNNNPNAHLDVSLQCIDFMRVRYNISCGAGRVQSAVHGSYRWFRVHRRRHRGSGVCRCCAHVHHQKLLDPNPERRMSAKEALVHPWITSLLFDDMSTAGGGKQRAPTRVSTDPSQSHHNTELSHAQALLCEHTNGRPKHFNPKTVANAGAMDEINKCVQRACVHFERSCGVPVVCC